MSESSDPTGTEAVASRIGRAGGVVSTRDGIPVVLDYGSVAGELAVCRSRVGIAVRTELSVAEVTGDENRLDEMMRKFVDDLGPYLGRIAADDGLLWSRSDLRRLIAVSVAPTDQLHTRVRTMTAMSVEPLKPRLDQLTAISVIGPRAGELLCRTYGATPAPSSSARAVRGGLEVALIHGPGNRFLLLAAKTRADAVLSSLLEVGDELGASMVGMNAVRLDAAGDRAVMTPC